MADPFLFKDILIIVFAAIFSSVVSYALRLPILIGFIFAGFLIGPYTTGLIAEKEMIEGMAEIGVVLLLFTIGIEFSLAELGSIGLRGVFAGLGQVTFTALVSAALVWFLGIAPGEAVVIGFIVSLSSTAIVLILFVLKGQIDTSYGKLTLGILLIQDMAIVPIMLFIQIAGSGDQFSAFEITRSVLLSVGALLLVIGATYYVVPFFLRQIVRVRSPEVFTMAAVFICLGTAWVSSEFGLSLALGAFIAGVVISQTDYSHQITASILPFRYIFNSIFFISIGMLLDPELVRGVWPMILFAASGIIVLKAVVAFVVLTLFRYSLNTALIVAVSLAQVGEFSFVLLETGFGFGIVSQENYSILLPSIILSMLATPMLVRYAPDIVKLIPRRGEDDHDEDDPELKEYKHEDHLVIAGYGMMGNHLAMVLKKTHIPYLVVDLNHELVVQARADGHIAKFGDISYRSVLKAVGAESARMIVFAISDPLATRRGVSIAKTLNPSLQMIVRTKHMADIQGIVAAGADQVISEEFEISIEVFARVLKGYQVPNNVIMSQIEQIRLEGYAMLRGNSLSLEKIAKVSEMLLASVSETFIVHQGAWAEGMSIAETDLRKKTGVTILAVVKKGETIATPPADTVLEADDLVVLIGKQEQVTNALDILQGSCSIAEHTRWLEEK